MLHLLYINPLNQDVFSILTPESNIIVQISKEQYEKYKYFYIYFSGFINKGRNSYVFSLYEKHNEITREGDKELYIDKDVIYMYEKRDKAYKITYDFLDKLFTSHELRFIDGKKVLFMPFKNFYYEHLSKKPEKNVSKLVHDINQIKQLSSTVKFKDLTDDIKKEIAPTIVGGE